MGWIYIDDIEITDAVNSIHVDTRDFHCNLLEEKIDLRDRRHPEITRCKHNNAYMIKADKIKEWLKGLETLTGGKGTWRLMSFRHTPDRGWFKYIRLYRIKDDMFIVCESHNEPVMWELMKESNLIGKDLLNHMKD